MLRDVKIIPPNGGEPIKGFLLDDGEITYWVANPREARGWVKRKPAPGEVVAEYVLDRALPTHHRAG